MRLLWGISFFWLALSMLLDGTNTLILPVQLEGLANENTRATTLGLLTFFGLMAGALIQPFAGALSDRLKPGLGRKGFIGIGLFLILVSLFFFAIFKSLAAMMVGYIAIQVSASIAQAGQQGLLPDLVDENRRGLASGIKGFMDITGAMLGFVILGSLLGSGQPKLALGVIAAALVVTYLIAMVLTPEDRPGKSRIHPGPISIGQVFHLDLPQELDFVRLLLSRFLFLLGVYAIGRFLLYFVADRLGLEAAQAAEKAGALLAGLALVTVLASPLTGWLADRFGRIPLMLAGSLLGAAGALTLIWAASSAQILLFGGLMSLGSAAFAGGSWALIADLVPKDGSARYFGLANLSTAGATAAAGLFGPIIDWSNLIWPGSRFTVLFIAAALAFAASMLPLRRLWKEVKDVRERTKGKIRADASGLAVLSLPADPAAAQEDPHPSGGTSRL
jgi:MFS family permease